MATELPPNEAEFTIDEIARATSGQVEQLGPERVHGVSTDTRQDLSGKLFVALRGERFDGHAFVGAAVRSGASAVLVSEDVSGIDGATVVRVPCTLAALGSLAAYHRSRWGGLLVAVAGSAGKTTTRAAVSAVLAAACPGKVHATRGNLNNRVGVPLVLFGLGERHRFGVIEIGTNALGEVADLARMVTPEVGILTRVGIEHAAGLGDLDSIEREEGCLLAGLPATGIAVANGDDPRAVRQLEASPAGTRIRYGTAPQCQVRVVRREPLGGNGTWLRVQRARGFEHSEAEVETRLLGLPGALAIAAALAVTEQLVGRALGTEELGRAMDSLGSGEPGRLTAIEGTDHTLVLDDTYNSNPASVQASLGAAREIAARTGSRLVLVFGEMRELGSVSQAEHTALGRAVHGSEVLVAVAGDARHAVGAARGRGARAEFAEGTTEAIEILRSILHSGDVVLVKGSRSVGLERVVESLSRGSHQEGAP